MGSFHYLFESFPANNFNFVNIGFNMKKKDSSNCDILLVGYEEIENLGLRSIAAFLNNKNISVKIEPYAESLKENILLSIKENRPKLVGFSLIFQRMLFDFADLVDYLRNSGVKAHFTMGGHYPTVEYKDTLLAIKGLDSVIRCEGEETLLELFKNLNKPNSWNKINGLAFKKGDEIITTPPRQLIENLDELPFPQRDNKFITHRDIGICSIIGSRGCAYACSFCSIRQFYNEGLGPKRRTRSPQNIVKEMELLFNEHNVRIFIFEDDDFVMKSPTQKKWIKNFVNELKKKKIDKKIAWRISCRVDDLDVDLIYEMMQAGLMSIYLGIESGSNSGLKVFNKKYKVDEIYIALDKFEKLNLPFEFGFMMLNPYSNFTTLKQDIVFLKKIGASGQTVINFTKMVPYSGTPIYHSLKKENRLTGSIESPDYKYNDPRIDLLQMFFTQAFHYRNFDNNGLVERLRHAKFDAIIMNKFFSNNYETKRYISSVQNIIRDSNAQCLETMSMAVNYMDMQNEKEIIDNWALLQKMVSETKRMESYYTSTLNHLMSEFSFQHQDLMTA